MNRSRCHLGADSNRLTVLYTGLHTGVTWQIRWIDRCGASILPLAAITAATCDWSANRWIIDRRLRPRCCHPESYFKHTSFSSHYIRRDIMCKHTDVIQIQHVHCGPVGPDRGLHMRQAQGCECVSLTVSAWRRRRTALAYVQI